MTTGGSTVSKTHTHTHTGVGFIEFPVSLWHIFFYTRPGWKDRKRSLADSLVNFVSMDKATVCLQYCSLYQIRDQVVPLCWHAHNRCRWIEGALSSIFRSPWWKKRNELYAMKLHDLMNFIVYFRRGINIDRFSRDTTIIFLIKFVNRDRWFFLLRIELTI